VGDFHSVVDGLNFEIAVKFDLERERNLGHRPTKRNGEKKNRRRGKRGEE